MRSLHAAAALAFGSLVLAASAQAQALVPTSGLALYDADGKRVGPIFSEQGSIGAWFAVRVGDAVLPLLAGNSLGETTIEGNWSSGPFFESTDCSGAPLFDLSGGFPYLMPLALVESATPGIGSEEDLGVVYVPDPADTPRDVFVRSEAQRGRSLRCVERAETHSVVRALGVLDFDAAFRRPLQVRAEPAVDLPGLAARVRALEAENRALRDRLGPE